MRRRLRWKIMLFTVLPIAALTLVTLGVVNRSISERVHRNVEHDLERAAAVMERLLQARDRELAVAARKGSQVCEILRAADCGECPCERRRVAMLTTARPHAHARTGWLWPTVAGGSDWPVVDVAGGYAHWWDATRELISGLDPAERAAVLGGTAASFYRLEEG